MEVRKMSKNLRRLTILLAAVCVMIIMAVPAFAEAGDSYYVVGTPTQYNTSDTIKVKVVVESREYSYTDDTIIDQTVTVPLTGSTSYTVLDVMRKFNNDAISPSVKACDSNGDPIAQTGNVDTINTFKKIIDSSGNNDKIYGYLFFANHGEGRMPCDGWVFRVNGQYPLLSETGENGGPKGAYISETPVADGDIVTFYTNYPWKENNTDWSTKFVGVDASYTAPDPAVPNSVGSLSIQLKSSSDWHSNSPFVWNINPFTNFAYFSVNSPTATLYKYNGDYVGTINISKSTGSGTLNATLSSGIYYIDVPTTRKGKWLSGYTWFTGNAYTYCYCIDSTRVYDKIVIS